MFRTIATVAKAGALLGTVIVIGFTSLTTATAVSVSSTQLQLVAGKSEAFVNTQKVQLDEPPVIVDGHFYLPAKWFSDTLNIQLYWDHATETAHLLTSKAYIQFDPAHDRIQVNGNSVPFHTVAEIRNGRLLVKLSWLASYTNITYRYNAGSQSVEISDLGEPLTAYKESTLRNDDTLQNSRPVAKFAFGKAAYRLGEPIVFTDLSYDPDSEGLPVYDWVGKKDVYFKAGIYNVSLTVKDGKGNVSEPFSKTVTVLDIPYRTEQEYPFYYKPIGSLLPKESVTTIPKQSTLDRILPVVVRQPEDRKLLRGSSSKPIIEKGFLFQEKINGRVRLYPQYVNGMANGAQLVIMIRNHSDIHAVNVSTTASSESSVSVYTPLHGRKTAENFLANTSEGDQLVVNPGSAVLYKVSPELSSGQGFQAIYDLETDGEVDVSYAMVSPGEQPYDLGGYRNIQLTDTERGTYPVSEVTWEIDAHNLKAPLTLGIGDGSVEPILKGLAKAKDKELLLETNNENNAGVRYQITLDVSGKTAIAVYPRGGFFEGAVRINGNLVTMPAAGLTSNEAIILHRSTGSEKKVVIELMAAGNTRLPMDLILIPLIDKQ
jgi:PKD repeat protein